MAATTVLLTVHWVFEVKMVAVLTTLDDQRVKLKGDAVLLAEGLERIEIINVCHEKPTGRSGYDAQFIPIWHYMSRIVGKPLPLAEAIQRRFEILGGLLRGNFLWSRTLVYALVDRYDGKNF